MKHYVAIGLLVFAIGFAGCAPGGSSGGSTTTPPVTTDPPVATDPPTTYPADPGLDSGNTGGTDTGNTSGTGGTGSVNTGDTGGTDTGNTDETGTITDPIYVTLPADPDIELAVEKNLSYEDSGFTALQ